MPVAMEGYSIDRELKPGQTWLATDALGRKVVLKSLPTDCLWRGQLHPSVATRLQHLRDLPAPSLGVPLGVEVTESGVMIINPYLEGHSLAELPEPARDEAMSKLERTIVGLHRLGVVHGAVKPENVIVNGGSVTLIHPSPLLHDDPQTDLAALAKMGWQAAGGNDALVDSPEDDSRRRRSAIAGFALVLAAICLAWVMSVYLSR